MSQGNSAPKRPLVDLEALRYAIRGMTRKTALYRVLKEELTACGYWKARPRGNPSAGYRMQRARLAKPNAPLKGEE